MGLEAIAFIIDVMVSGLSAWIAARLRSTKVKWIQILLILFGVSALSLVPVVGFVFALALFVFLLTRYTELSVADAIWTVLIAKMLAMTILMLMGLQFAGDPLHFLYFRSHMTSHFIE
jgi:hypothetical protein